MGMSVNDLRSWMDKNNKNVIDVASLTGLSPGTVTRFLAGEDHHRSTAKLIEQLVKQGDSAKAAASAG